LNGIVDQITDLYRSLLKKNPSAAYTATVNKFGERIMKDWTYPALPAIPRLLEPVTRSETASSDYGPSTTADDVAREQCPVPPKGRRVHDPNSRKNSHAFKTPMRSKMVLDVTKKTSSKKVFKKTLKTLNRKDTPNVPSDDESNEIQAKEEQQAVKTPMRGLKLPSKKLFKKTLKTFNRKQPNAFDSVKEGTTSTPNVLSDDESTDKEEPQASTSVRQETGIRITDQDVAANFSLGTLPVFMPDDVEDGVMPDDDLDDVVDDTIFIPISELFDVTGAVVNANNLHRKNPLYNTSNSIVDVEVEASTSTRPQQDLTRPQKDMITITDLKMFFVDQFKELKTELKTELKEHQDKCLAEIIDKAKESPEVCAGQRKYASNVARKALTVLNKLAPSLIQHMKTKEEEEMTEGHQRGEEQFRALCAHVNAKLQLDQSGRLIEVLFNTSIFLEAVAIVFKAQVDDLINSSAKMNGINIYRYVLKRLFTQQQLAHMCFGGNGKKYVKIFNAYSNAFQ
jgi:hypothetical protein